MAADLNPQRPSRLYSKPLHGVQFYGDGLAEFESLAGPSVDRTNDVISHLKLETQPSRPALKTQPTWSLTDKGDRYSTLIELYQQNQETLLNVECEGRGTFKYSDNAINVSWEAQGTGPAHYMQSIGLAVWLEQQGTPCIHANALAIGNQAVGILAPSQMGKTSMTLALMQLGCELMTDDMLALHEDSNAWQAFPSWPVFRIWPDSTTHLAKRVLGADVMQLPQVHDRFEKRIVDVDAVEGINHCKQAKPISCLYLLERRESATTNNLTNNDSASVHIEVVPPAQAMIHLLQNSILGSGYSALGVEQQRLRHLARFVEAVPLKKVIYSSGMELLPAVSKILMEDFSTP